MILAQTEDAAHLSVINALRSAASGHVPDDSNAGVDSEQMEPRLTDDTVAMDLSRDFLQDLNEDVFGFFAETDGDIFSNHVDDGGYLNLLAI